MNPPPGNPGRFNNHTSLVADDPRILYGMLGIASVLALLMVFRNFRGAGLVWGLVGTGAQAGLVFLFGPWLGVGLLIWLFYQLVRGGHSPSVYGGGSPQTETVYINNTDY